MGPLSAITVPLAFLLIQSPDHGSIQLYSAPREVRRVYWE
jgi:hypothetical protein